MKQLSEKRNHHKFFSSSSRKATERLKFCFLKGRVVMYFCIYFQPIPKGPRTSICALLFLLGEGGSLSQSRRLEICQQLAVRLPELEETSRISISHIYFILYDRAKQYQAVHTCFSNVF